MLVSRLVPLLVMGGIGIHSGPAIKERMSGMLGIAEKTTCRQRMVALMEAATLAAATESEIPVADQKKFRAWVRRAIRIKGQPGADSSLDPWGIAYYGQMSGTTLIITSAGPDKKFATKDDIRLSQNVYDY
jgi:hypothetical protein